MSGKVIDRNKNSLLTERSYHRENVLSKEQEYAAQKKWRSQKNHVSGQF